MNPFCFAYIKNKRCNRMEGLIYSIKINNVILQLEENSLVFCLSINNGTEMNVLIHSDINESLDVMYYLFNLWELTF